MVVKSLPKLTFNSEAFYVKVLDQDGRTHAICNLAAEHVANAIAMLQRAGAKLIIQRKMGENPSGKIAVYFKWPF